MVRLRAPLSMFAATLALGLVASGCGSKMTHDDARGIGGDPDANALPGSPGEPLTATKILDEQVHLASTPTLATAQLRILETTDLHVNMEAFDYYRNVPTLNSGLVRAGTVLRRARKEVNNSFTVDNGDLLQGTPLGDWFVKERDPKKDLHTVFKAMNLLGYDVANLGNHDFNYGLDFLEAALQGANFPYVNANVVKAGTDLKSYKGFDQGGAKTAGVLPYVILTRNLVTDEGKVEQVKIGVLGLVTPQIMMWDRNNLEGKVDSEDQVETAKLMVPRMRAEGADVVILVPHSGISAAPSEDRQENAVYYLAGVPGVDAILCGHSHQVFPSATYSDIPNADLDKGLLRGVPTVMAGFWGSHVGVVDLKLKRDLTGWHVASGTAAAREVDKVLAATDYEKDLRDAVAVDHQSTIQYLQQPVGTSSTEIDSFFSLATPSLAVELVQQAQIWDVQKIVTEGGAAYTSLKGMPLLSASAPYKSGANSSDYTDVPAGPVTLRNVADLYVYPNTVQVTQISGATVVEWLEMAASAFHQIKSDVATPQELWAGGPGYNFDTLLGLSYVIDVSQPPRYEMSTGKLINPSSHRVTNILYHNLATSDGSASALEGKPIDLTSQHLVVTNNYRANGGGHFPIVNGATGAKIVLNPGQDSRQVVGDYFIQKTAEHASIDSVLDPHWVLKPVPGAKVVLHTAAAAKSHAAETNGLITYMSDDLTGRQAGFASYQVNWPAR